MSKNPRIKPVRPIQVEEEPSSKATFKDKFKSKQETHQQAHDRRQRLRDIRDERDWN